MEFFSKPFDSHWNPADIKGIMFDTNESHRPGSIWKMFAGNKISAYGGVKEFVTRFKKNDYAMFYYARTDKVPFLSRQEAEIIIEMLKIKYNEIKS